MKRIICIMLLACMFFSGCTAAQHEEAEADKIKAYISVYAEHEDRFILESTEVLANSDETVLELTRRLFKEKKIHMETGGDGEAAYVKGIDNIYEFDAGAQSGWLFYVNGETPSEGAGSLKITDGDKIEWIYVTDWSKA